MGATCASARGLLSLVWQGRTIHRACMELQLRESQVNGLTLDLGSGKSSYFRLMQRDPSARLLRVDVSPECKPQLVADLEHPLPLNTASVDSIVLLNVLEHLYHYEQTLGEIARVLRPGGRLFLFVPFLIAVHTARRGAFFTDDCFRYTGSSLRRLLTESAGFGGPVGVTICAWGPFTAAVGLAIPALRWRTWRTLATACALMLDHILDLGRGRPGTSHSEWAIGYYVEATR